jgi:transcriptional regulator with AAA-type ATPase domain
MRLGTVHDYLERAAAAGIAWPLPEGLSEDSAWVRNYENIFVLGPTGVGKRFIASALAQKACRDSQSAATDPMARLRREVAFARFNPAILPTAVRETFALFLAVRG